MRYVVGIVLSLSVAVFARRVGFDRDRAVCVLFSAPPSVEAKATGRAKDADIDIRADSSGRSTGVWSRRHARKAERLLRRRE